MDSIKKDNPLTPSLDKLETPRLPAGTALRVRKNKKAKHSSLKGKINSFLLRLSRVPLKEKLFFVQYLTPMLKVGISLSTALKTLSKQAGNKYFKSILSDMAVKVEGGTSFTESIEPYRKVFGDLFIHMIEAGEVSGGLENVLHQLYVQMKKEHDLISKVKGALIYPIIVLLAMIGIGIFMFIVVIPRMLSIFSEMNVELPLPTRILISVSNAVANNGLLVLIILIVLIILFIQILRTKKGKYFFHAVLLKIPVISPIVKKINLARFARNISSLLKTDIMIVKTFQITANVLGNLHYKDAIMEMGDKIKRGDHLSDSIKGYPKLFPPVVTQMVSVGEETGELDNILIELAEFYENEVDEIMKILPSVIEPLLILILGLGVGGLAAAIIMPMYSLSSSI